MSVAEEAMTVRQTIEDLYNGKIVPCEQEHVRSEKYREAIERMAELEQQLLGLLDDSGKGILEAYQDAQVDATVEKDQANFVYGFRLCVKLILESLDERLMASRP